jgi:sulfite oxidase
MPPSGVCSTFLRGRPASTWSRTLAWHATNIHSKRSPWIAVNGRRFHSTSAAEASPTRSQRYASYAVAAGIGVAAAAFLAYGLREAHAEAPIHVHVDSSPRATFRLSEVQAHGIDSDRQWVTRGTKVYDITEWVSAHPGGEVILRAVGGAIDKYWDIFSIHKKQDVYDILESYCIGEIDPRDLVDGGVPLSDIDDPFKTDPKRDARLQQHTQRPCNAETPPDELQSFITPNETFYVRNHMWVPSTEEAKNQKLTIELPDGSEKVYTLQDLQDRFQEVNITATLQCSGNRRKHMTEEAQAAQGLQWGVGAISNAEWTGVRLRDVLADAGFPVDDWPEDARHAQFIGAESYGASIPIDKAVDRRGDVLIAYGMNGKPLPHDHGYPMRMLVPGHVAARSVKWVNKVIISEDESQSQWQKRDYKCFGPNVLRPDWETAPAIQDTPVQSAITSLRNLSRNQLKDDTITKTHGTEDLIAVEGYSYAGGGRAIVRVDVSADDGQTWHQAEMLMDETKGHKAWSWRRWRFILPKGQAGSCFVVKAVDEANNCQPESYMPQYNFRGNLTTSWHRVCYPPPEDQPE